MDPQTVLALFGSVGGAQVLVRVLGPTADYLGNELQDWTKRRRENVARILENADMKLDDDVEGAVSPRVLAGIMNEGSFNDAEVAVDYLGGVLASSKSGVSRDDRGATFTALVNRLSTYELRTHYILYSIARSLLLGTQENFADSGVRLSNRVFVPNQAYVTAMDFSDDERFEIIAPHVFWGLHRENLIGDAWAYGSPRALGAITLGALANEPGIVFEVSMPGIELFLWAHGLGRYGFPAFTDAEMSMAFETGIPIGTKGSLRVTDL